jgi:predicted RNA-binding protein with PIN domain
MPVSFLVDGYNLLFTLGMLERRDGTRSLARARHRLLDYLGQVLGGEHPQVTVVFDGGRTPRGSDPEPAPLGIQVRFSGGGESADDVIEAFLAASPRPQDLIVISNDHRIQEAARRRGAQPWTCAALLDHIELRAKPHRPVLPGEPDRPLAPSPAEARHWLEEFGNLADDPEFRELFERFRFDDEGEAP